MGVRERGLNAESVSGLPLRADPKARLGIHRTNWGHRIGKIVPHLLSNRVLRFRRQ